MAILPTIYKILDRNTARQLATVFMELYKKGVNDAAEADDEGLVREHVEMLAVPDNFGYVGTVRNSHTYWENRIIDIAEEKNFRKIMLRYFDRLGKFGASYLSVALIIAKDFYVRGLEDWLANPDGSRFTDFRKYQWAWWTKDGVKKIDRFHLRSFVQDRCDHRIAAIRDGVYDKPTENQYNQFKMTFSFALVAKV